MFRRQRIITIELRCVDPRLVQHRRFAVQVNRVTALRDRHRIALKSDKPTELYNIWCCTHTISRTRQKFRWARPGSGFTLLMEVAMLTFAKTHAGHTVGG